MATNGETKDHVKAVIGDDKNFWLYDSQKGFDLTHPPKPDSPATSPSVKIKTKTSPITIDPAKSALVVVDMQNFFLSSALGKTKGNGHKALDQLVNHAIPACRKACIRIIWLNWGLSQQEIDDMPPSVLKAFGFTPDSIAGVDQPLEKYGRVKYNKSKGLGSDMGRVTDPETGKEIEAGKMLMRDQWNTALYPPLDKLYDEGKDLDSRPDVWIHKNRMSGMWGPSTACEEFLEKEGIKTLFFTGVNTDQCVGGTYQDSFSKGYDCVLLNDGCGTTSPDSAQHMIEFNSANVWGFMTSCEALAEGAEDRK